MPIITVQLKIFSSGLCTNEICNDCSNLFPQAGTFVQLLDGEDSDEKAVTAMGILNTLETMLNVMEKSKEVHVIQIEWLVLKLSLCKRIHELA